MRILTGVIYLIVFLVPDSALAFQFSTALENSQWQSESSPYACKLEHGIEGYGKGSVVHNAGENASLIIKGQGYAFDNHNVQVTSAPPKWRPGRTSQVIFEIKPQQGNVVVAGQQVNEVLSVLSGGMLIAFKGILKESNHQPFDVYLSSVGFQSEFDKFKKCEDQLLPVNFSQVERTRIQYKTGTIKIPKSGEHDLDRIVTYLNTDKSIQQVFVDGHTDNAGLSRDNVRVSEQRAVLVTEYLIDHGIPAGKIVTRYHGEKYPVVRNDTVKNRAMNRRTTIRLSRVTPVAKPMKSIESEATKAGGVEKEVATATNTI